MRGRPVRLRKAALPHGTASGLWIERTTHDLIVYEQNTDREHQLVIIGHEAWHMFQGGCTSATGHGAAATRSQRNAADDTLAELLAAVSEADDAGLPPAGRTDAALHFAARTDAWQIDEEHEAELFGFRFATDVQAALAAARNFADPHDLAGRIQVSMAPRAPRD
ncbi:toxin-antitoxin system, toxin component [Streptomyces sp. SAS_260]|uniref:toxin-antitoxin system, toxin component n=1 Tax=Streptomyces sp. SAS_260 TaxID=3412751 RepID=UPI00403C58A6